MKLLKNNEANYWLEILCARFGFPISIFAPFQFGQANRKQLFLLNRDHNIFPNQKYATFGLPFLNILGAVPKLSNTSAIKFGFHATQNILDIEFNQLPLYFSGDRFKITATDAPDQCTRGFILIRYSQVILGLAFLRIEEGNPGKLFEIESLFPKRKGQNTLNAFE